MPSIATTVLTSAVTLTSLVSVTAGQYPTSTPVTEECPTCTQGSYLPPDVIGPIEGLAQCTQGIVFECLASSTCSPHDFACICAELSKLGVEGRVEAVCSHDEYEQYLAFQNDVCSGGYVPGTTTPAANTTSTSTWTPVPYATGASNVTTTVPGPFINTTLTMTEYATQTVQVVTTNAAGQPTTVSSEVVVPVGTSVAPAAYTGAAAAVGAPIMAGVMGLMGLVFAGL